MRNCHAGIMRLGMQCTVTMLLILVHAIRFEQEFFSVWPLCSALRPLCAEIHIVMVSYCQDVSSLQISLCRRAGSRRH